MEFSVQHLALLDVGGDRYTYAVGLRLGIWARRSSSTSAVLATYLGMRHTWSALCDMQTNALARRDVSQQWKQPQRDCKRPPQR